MEDNLFNELRESAKKAIKANGKPLYWHTLVELMRSSASNGHYYLKIKGRIYDGKEPQDETTKMLEDLLKNQDLYEMNLRENELKMKISANMNPLPSILFDDHSKYYTEVHLEISWGDNND